MLENHVLEGSDGAIVTFHGVVRNNTRGRATLRLDTPREREYVRHGGILPYVLRKLATA